MKQAWVYILYLSSTHFTLAKVQYGVYLKVFYIIIRHNTTRCIEMLVYE
jgi:hypothetical protein